MPSNQFCLPAALAGVLCALTLETQTAESLFHEQSSTKANPLRNAYFGDLHLHTKYSFDAFLNGPREIDPDLAYRFARGERVRYMDHDAKRRWPLDFAAVTDHSEYIGVLCELDNLGSALSKTTLGQEVRAGNKEAMMRIWSAFSEGKPFPAGDGQPIAAAAWQKEINAANDNYRPGIFTTFIGYEWTSSGETKSAASGDIGNLHRNVIFRGDKAPLPFTAIDSKKPEDLWTYLEANRKRGIEALAIPHNPNGSNGLMYDWKDTSGKPIDRAYAMRRVFNEPLSEISQTKGQSETNPLLAPNDEFADFEVRESYLRKSYLQLAPSGRGKDGHGSSIREAYGRGLILAGRIGANPFQFGVNGGSDFHNGLSTSDEDAYSGVLGGAHGGVDPTQDYFVAEIRQKMLVASQPTTAHESEGLGYEPKDSGSGSLTGVWAEENTRESIYDALRRKETFATSGTRLKVRFFGSWSYPLHLAKDPDYLEVAYRNGVSMGGDLPAKPATAGAPRFLVWALKDPDGANLDRIQIVKLWLQGENHKEKIFDVAWSGRRSADPKTGKVPPVGNTVAASSALYANTIGATELKTVWEDPEFDPAASAVYYIRVLEIPTPRWTTIQAVRAGIPAPTDVPATLQERAWSSPIWYAPQSGRNRN